MYVSFDHPDIYQECMYKRGKREKHITGMFVINFYGQARGKGESVVKEFWNYLVLQQISGDPSLERILCDFPKRSLIVFDSLSWWASYDAFLRLPPSFPRCSCL